MATQPLRKLFPSASVFFFASNFTPFYCSLVAHFPQPQEHSVPEHQLDEFDRPGKNQLVRRRGIRRRSDNGVHFIACCIVGERENVLVLVLTGSWSSASTDWSLCGWYRWAVITAQWEGPWITSLRLNESQRNIQTKAPEQPFVWWENCGRGAADCSYGTHLSSTSQSSAFPQVTVALISFLETMLITYLSYKVGNWSARPHFFFPLGSIHCTFSFPSDTLIYLTPVAKRIPVCQRTPTGSVFLSQVFLSVVLDHI